MIPNEVASADGAGPLRFAFVALRRATAEFCRAANSMSNRKLLITSVGLLALLGLVRVANLPGAIHSEINSEGPVSARLAAATGSFVGMVVPLVLAFCQWRNGGRWGLGIGIFASVTLPCVSLVFYLVATSARVKLDTRGIVSFLVWIVALSALAVVNFWLYARQRKESP